MAFSITSESKPFLHGVRGAVYINDVLIGVAQGVNFSDDGEDDWAYIMGSRFPQSKEIKNKSVRGTIKTMIFDSKNDLFHNLVVPIKYDVSPTDVTSLAGITGVNSASTKITVTNDIINDSHLGYMPVFNIVLKNVVAPSSETDANQFVTYTISGVMLQGKDYSFEHDTWWTSNVKFIADSISVA